MQLDDWLPSLEQVSMWNSWSDKNRALAVYWSPGSALQEWNLLGSDEKDSFSNAVEACIVSSPRFDLEARLWQPMISVI